MSDKSILVVDGQEMELPAIAGTEGERSIDITQLRNRTGLTTCNPSLGNTAACKSEITFIDGEKGIFRCQGIPIEEFSRNPSFFEVAWLLIFGNLPKHDDLAQFRDQLTTNELLDEELPHHSQHIPVEAPPMAILLAMLSNMARLFPSFLPLDDSKTFTEAVARLIGKVRTIAAFSYRHSPGLPVVYLDPSLCYCTNPLHMMFSIPYQQYTIRREIEATMNLTFILNADHELLWILTFSRQSAFGTMAIDNLRRI